MEIITLNKVEKALEANYQKQVQEIFFLCTSVKEFRDEKHRKEFFEKWCGGYLSNYPEQFYIFVKEGRVLGYLSGALNSYESLNVLNVPGASNFKDLFDEFKAHFHINCHPDSQGLGIGRKLVEAFCSDTVKLKINGVHLVTSTDADNLGFYRKLGFKNEFKKDHKGMELLLMGRKNLP